MTHVGAFDMTGNVREWTSSADRRRPRHPRRELERSLLCRRHGRQLGAAGGPLGGQRPAADDVAGRIHRRRSGSERRSSAPPCRPMSATRPCPMTCSPRTDACSTIVADRSTRRSRLSIAPEALDSRACPRFDAGYGDERLILHLYLPTTGSPPYQTVLYWPGWDTFALDDVDQYFAKQLDFIVKSGRAAGVSDLQGHLRAAGRQRAPAAGFQHR